MAALPSFTLLNLSTGIQWHRHSHDHWTQKLPPRSDSV